MKWGGRLRQSFLDDTSVSNFGGTYNFFGGAGPELDANNNIVPGSIIQLTALERYQRTLYLQSIGMSPAQIRLLGGGASQFSLGAGIPTTSVSQFDVGLFFTDDWRLKPNFTLSYGLRYETQTNISDFKDWSPRVGIAWGIDGSANKAAKTVLRAGFGIFYDRVADSITLQADRFNGLTQQSYLLVNPNFFPRIPTAEELSSAQQPQRLQIMDQSLVAPRNYQASIGLDRQINKYFRLSGQYIVSRGVHVERSRNINAPIDGSFPYGDAEQRILTETTGFSRMQQLVISPNISYKKLFLFGFYSYGHGRSDAEGNPADPYNLRAEWGPSSFGDIRHRFVVGTSIPTFWKVSISPFITGSQRLALHDHNRTRHQQRRLHLRAPSVSAQPRRLSLRGRRPHLQRRFRLFQQQPRLRRGYPRPQLGARPVQLLHQHARRSYMVLRQPWRVRPQ